MRFLPMRPAAFPARPRASSILAQGKAALAANTTYFFEITLGQGSPGAYFEMNSTSLNGYAGGQAHRGDNAGALDANNVVNALPGDFAFHANLTAIEAGVTYNITASAGTGGAISPAGVTAVAENSTPTYTITPGIGYDVADVVLDGTGALNPD